jgi:hypothetical protein
MFLRRRLRPSNSARQAVEQATAAPRANDSDGGSAWTLRASVTGQLGAAAARAFIGPAA